MASSLNNPAWLEWMATLLGGASRQTFAATLPPERFYCLLDELPLHLIPQHLNMQESGDRRSETLFVNPECMLCAPGQMPDDLFRDSESLAEFARQGFALQGTVAWVRDRATRNLLPFWLGPELESVLRGLRAKDAVPPGVPARARSLLKATGILIPEEGVARCDQTRDEIMSKAARLFRERGYAPISGLIHPFHLAALRRYYRRLIRIGAIRLGDSQSPRRYAAYNEPVARFFHHQIAETFSVVAGEPLQPSYVYFASYTSGAELEKHTDRKQCEFSVTLCLDFSPEPKLETPWPIRLDTPSGRVTVYQALGDGLAYRGTRLPHYRDRLSGGLTSTSIFFHYVGEDFSGPLG
jgi:hypothetical protein